MEKKDVMRSENSQGFRMMGNNNNRRALRDINNLAVNNVPYSSKIFKKVLTDDEKNKNSFAGRRPMTRRFAASLAQNSQDCFQNANIRVKSISSEAQGGNQMVKDASFAGIDEEENVAFPIDEPLPMVEEIEEMDVEMEDLEAKLLEEIDICDSNNSLAVVKYVNDIYSFYRETEGLACVPPNYMSNQLDINERMRAILIDWLIEVHYKFELVEETLFLTVNLIDRFLTRQNDLPRRKLQLVGITAMLLACKYEEVMVPVVDDLILIADRAYSREEILQMESLMVNTVQFNMSVPTPYMFMRRFLKAAQSDRQIEHVSSYIIELCLVEYEMLKFCPSMLAAAAVYTAQCSLKGFKHWSRTSELCTKYSEIQLLDCSRMMVEFHQKSGKGKLNGVHKKYSTFKFGCAAKSEPAFFLLDRKN